MDDLRWILAIAGVVVIAAIYLSGRFEKEEWKRDRGLMSDHTEPVNYERLEPKIEENSSDVNDVSVGLNSKEDVTNALYEPVPDTDTVNSKDEDDDSEENVDVPLPEDGIEVFEIPAELAKYGEERRSKQRHKIKQDDREPVQHELGLGVEPLVLVLTVLTTNESLFSGRAVKSILEEEGLSHGEMEIFHFRMGNEKDSVFSVANVVEPGIFDLNTFNEEQTPGLSLFCQLPGPVASTGAFELMLKKGRHIAKKLDGQLCDDRRNVLTEQATSHYRDRIASFDHEMTIARKKLD